MMSLSIDTNIVFPAVQAGDGLHVLARGFLESLGLRNDVLISEFVLLELYQLLRNPAVVSRPLSAPDAVAVCAGFRSHSRWQVVALPPATREFHDALWPRLAQPGVARRRAFDWRMALSLLHHGVTEFATVNVRDFDGFGFKRVWNPLAPPRDRPLAGQ